MNEKKLLKLIHNAQELRNETISTNSNGYNYDGFDELKRFILKKLHSPLFNDKNAQIIANHFDEILPLIVMSNIDIIFLYSNVLIKQPGFKEKFKEGLKKYPYKNCIHCIFYEMNICLGTDEFNNFIDEEILTIFASQNLGFNCCDIFNSLNEVNQSTFLYLLVQYKANIPYLAFEYKGNNKQIIYDNIDLFIHNSQNLYTLMNFVKDNPVALSKVKEYIDNNEEQAINSIFCETDKLEKITDSDLKEMIKILILEIVKNEKVNFSDITYSGGGFSRIILIGDKVLKLGDRWTKTFPNNPYIIAPLLRQEVKMGNSSCFIEITEKVDTSERPTEEELYQLYKKLRDIGLIWTDIKGTNVGRLKKENIIHWNEELNPSDEVLGFSDRRGSEVLKEGDLVILDADFIYDENDPNISYVNQVDINKSFSERYQKEKNEQIKTSEVLNQEEEIIEEETHGISR